MTSSPAPQRPTFHVALYQPDIAGNTGSILRTAACLGFAVHLIGPAGFDASDRALRRAGLDYLARAEIVRHASFDAFLAARGPGRLVLATSRGETAYTEFAFRSGDTLMFGRESEGVPEAVHDLADARLAIPMAEGMRSLNVAVAAAMMLGEALRQTRGFPVQG